jgi:hypothetical protein
LYYASFFGLVDVVCSLLGHERDINEVSGFFGDALSAAASQVRSPSEPLAANCTVLNRNN